MAASKDPGTSRSALKNFSLSDAPGRSRKNCVSKTKGPTQLNASYIQGAPIPHYNWVCSASQSMTTPTSSVTLVLTLVFFSLLGSLTVARTVKRPSASRPLTIWEAM